MIKSFKKTDERVETSPLRTGVYLKNQMEILNRKYNKMKLNTN